MSRYIDMDKLKKKKKYSFQTNYGAFPKHEYFIKLQDLLEAPTADVKEVKHAYWIPVTYGECKCSICGNIYGLCGGLMGDYNYCPGCGAKMDKEQEDETH